MGIFTLLIGPAALVRSLAAKVGIFLQGSAPVAVAPSIGRRARAVRVGLLAALGVVFGAIVLTGGSHVALAAGSVTSCVGNVETCVQTAADNVTNTIRVILGATAVIVFMVAAFVNHFVYDPRSKDRAREMMVAAIAGLLIAAFAQDIVSFVEGI